MSLSGDNPLCSLIPSLVSTQKYPSIRLLVCAISFDVISFWICSSDGNIYGRAFSICRTAFLSLVWVYLQRLSSPLVFSSRKLECFSFQSFHHSINRTELKRISFLISLARSFPASLFGRLEIYALTCLCMCTRHLWITIFGYTSFSAEIIPNHQSHVQEMMASYPIWYLRNRKSSSMYAFFSPSRMLNQITLWWI